MYGLIFDVDGVIADSEGPIARATIKMFRDLYGVKMKRDDFKPFIGTGAVRYVEGPAEKYGIKVDLEKALEGRHNNFRKIIQSGESIVLPGVHALIEAAHESMDWKLGIATSSPRDKSHETLEAARVDANKFDAYINGDMVTHKKPHPEIYLKAADALHLYPVSCVVVEDALTGVESAKAAGMRVVAVTNSFSRKQLAAADWVVDSLEEVDLEKLHHLISKI